MVERCLQDNGEEFLHVLVENDQLNIERTKKRTVFSGFEEAPITFMPTYKFDADTDVYDSSEKRRIPSWTDRVLYREKFCGRVFLVI